MLVDFADCSARLLISSATTAKPFPASPALAASIAAFKASKFVWSAIPEIRLLASPILPALSLVLLIRSKISLKEQP